MKTLVRLLILVPVALLAAVFAAMNLGAEVVVLTTTDAEGRRFETPLWILAEEGALWIRAERPSSDWLARLRAQPLVEIERGGDRTRYRALPAPESRGHVNELMAERYGWVEELLALLQNRDTAIPIRLARWDGGSAGAAAEAPSQSPGT